MKYVDFYKLSYLSFKRSPNFSKKLILKILSIIGYLLLLVYLIAFALLAYYGIKEKFPGEDIFKKGNEYLFIYFFIVIYLMMYISFDSMKVKPFMLLPVRKKKIIHFHLFQVLSHPVNLALLLMLGIYLYLVGRDGYDISGLLAWGIAVASSLYILNYLLFFSSRNPWWGILMSLLFFMLIFKIKTMNMYFRPVGKIYYQIYLHKYWALIPVLLLIAIYIFLYKYLLNRFYTDDAVKPQKKGEKIRSLSLPGIEKYGLMGSFVRNDIRLIWRNTRPRQSVPGIILFFAMAAFLYSDLGAQNQQPEFNKIMFTMFLTGYFVVSFGNQIPAWDSEYYPFLMTQGINYRQYIEAKWWLLTVSVILLSILSVPFIYFGWKVLALIWIMAIFNIGVNIPLVLLSGIFNTKPIKLNQKVKAFQSNENFKLKNFAFSMIRLFVPIIIYLLLKKYTGYYYATGSFLLMGLLGIVFKDKILNYISNLYVQQKYNTLSAFRKAEE